MQTLLTIGALEQASGVPASTLRTWERRYNFPPSTRTPGGHRLYHPDLVEHLDLVQQALESGHRAAQVLPLSLQALKELLWTSSPDQTEAWLKLTRALDAPGLRRVLELQLAREGAGRFLEDTVAPFLRVLGEGWATGELAIYHEHFASEVIGAFLSERWRSLSVDSADPVAVLTTPEGEQHQVGLQMAAFTLRLAGWRVLFLGPSVPHSDLLRCADQSMTLAVGLSIAPSLDPIFATSWINQLRAALPAHIHLLTGGAGAPEVEGVTRLATLPELDRWAREHHPRS